MNTITWTVSKTLHRVFKWFKKKDNRKTTLLTYRHDLPGSMVEGRRTILKEVQKVRQFDKGKIEEKSELIKEGKANDKLATHNRCLTFVPNGIKIIAAAGRTAKIPRYTGSYDWRDRYKNCIFYLLPHFWSHYFCIIFIFECLFLWMSLRPTT